MALELFNWAGNLSFGAARLHRPQTVEQLREVVAGSRKLKVIGSRHSFNEIADTTGDLVSLERLQQEIVLDRERRGVTVGGGVTFGQLCGRLHAEGFALPNLASLPHITVAGACATATHGSGDSTGVLATSVAALELVTGAGEVVSLTREADGKRFQGAVVGLGGLGIVTRLTLDVVPDFAVRQEVYENLPLSAVEAHFDEITASAYSVSLFTGWRDGCVSQVWLKRRRPGGTPGGAAGPPAAGFFGAALAPVDRHPIVTLSAECCTPQMGVPGPWHERLPHFRMEHQPSSSAELQTEYMVPRRHAVPAFRALAALGERMAPLLQISEVRTIAADSLWMSPCYGQRCVAFHFTWEKDWPGVRELLPVIEAELEPFEARPHWGKLFTMPPEHLQSLYARLPDFQGLLQEFDPDSKFRNAFLDRYIWAASGAA